MRDESYFDDSRAYFAAIAESCDRLQPVIAGSGYQAGHCTTNTRHWVGSESPVPSAGQAWLPFFGTRPHPRWPCRGPFSTRNTALFPSAGRLQLHLPHRKP